MGEAKRKRERYLTPAERSLVADIVRSVNIDHQVAESGSNPLVANLSIITPDVFDLRGGECLFRTLCGEAAMVALGTGYRTVIGGLLYRAGPDPVRDTMGFADGHGGNFLPDGRFYGHTWLQVGANIVDFSCGDWKGIATAAGEAGTDNLDHIENLAPIVWESTPPQFFWKYRARLEPTREICAAEAKRNGGYLSPPVGHAWYLGFDQSKYSEAVSMLERFRANAHANPVMERAVKHVMRQIVKHFGRPQPHPRGLSSLSNDFGGKE